jgi:hypothetical protein
VETAVIASLLLYESGDFVPVGSVFHVFEYSLLEGYLLEDSIYDPKGYIDFVPGVILARKASQEEQMFVRP